MSNSTVGDAAIAVVRRNTEEVQGKGNWNLYEELFADDFVDHTPQPSRRRECQPPWRDLGEHAWSAPEHGLSGADILSAPIRRRPAGKETRTCLHRPHGNRSSVR